jgi:hypothetical protein
MPANVASRVQDYYAAHPSDKAQEITRQYAANIGTINTGESSYKQGTLITNTTAGEGGFTGRAAEYKESWTPITRSVLYGGEAPNSAGVYYVPKGINPFRSDSAAGIEWDVAATGGYVGKTLSDKAVNPENGQKINLPESWVWDQKTDAGAAVLDYGNVVSSTQMVDVAISPGRNVYVPIGEMEQQLRTDAKLVVSASGAYEVWQTPKNTLPGSDFTRIYPMITAGGSDYALQSGMVSGKAQTPWVVDEYGGNALWKASDNARVADIQANPSSYSRLGSELYGGIVQKLLPDTYNSIELAWGRGQTVEPGTYPAVRENYAMLVNFEDVNAAKGTVSDASDLPAFGSISPEQFAAMPSLQKVDTSGNLSPATMKTVEAATPYVSTSLGYSTAETPTVSVGSSFSLKTSARVLWVKPRGFLKDWQKSACGLAPLIYLIQLRLE